MPSPDSVTHWLGRLQGGDQAAAQPLWECYFQRLVELAHKKLKGSHLAAANEEDMALSAFDSFCRGAAGGRFPQLGDRDDLWRLLVVMTARKVYHAQRDENRLKRGGSGPASAGVHDEPDSQDVESIVKSGGELFALACGIGEIRVNLRGFYRKIQQTFRRQGSGIRSQESGERSQTFSAVKSWTLTPDP